MEEVDYCADPRRVSVFPGAAQALQRLKDRDYRLFMITNQSGIGRGYFTETDFDNVQAEFFRQLGPNLIDAVYHCSDAPEHATDRRKPGAGMVLDAAREHDLSLPRSFLIGDSWADVECGKRASLAATVFVLTGKGAGELSRCQPDFVADDLAAAADWILERSIF